MSTKKMKLQDTAWLEALQRAESPQTLVPRGHRGGAPISLLQQ
jgi:hypothetical protein